MAWSYSGNPGESAKDNVRFLIGDTDNCDQLLQDGEITYLLSLYNNAPLNAALRCCEMIAAKFSREADQSVGRVSQNYSQKARAYRALKKDITNRLGAEDMIPYAGGLSYTDMSKNESNPDAVKGSFSRDMMENRQIGPAVSDSWNGGWFGAGFW